MNNARVALSYTIIRSPLDGRTGQRGAPRPAICVTANSTELMTIAQMQPVYVTFAVPAVHLSTIKRHMAEGRLMVTATPQDTAAKPATGRPDVRRQRRRCHAPTPIKLEGDASDNADRELWPGQFTRVTSASRDALAGRRRAERGGADRARMAGMCFVVKLPTRRSSSGRSRPASG